jgi:hypothetical protein
LQTPIIFNQPLATSGLAHEVKSLEKDLKAGLQGPRTVHNPHWDIVRAAFRQHDACVTNQHAEKRWEHGSMQLALLDRLIWLSTRSESTNPRQSIHFSYSADNSGLQDWIQMLRDWRSTLKSAILILKKPQGTGQEIQGSQTSSGAHSLINAGEKASGLLYSAKTDANFTYAALALRALMVVRNPTFDLISHC